MVTFLYWTVGLVLIVAAAAAVGLGSGFLFPNIAGILLGGLLGWAVGFFGSLFLLEHRP